VFDLLWEKKEQKESQDVSVWVSYYELVNQKINDMLAEDSTEMRIAENINGNIKGLKMFQIETMNDFKEMIEISKNVADYRNRNNMYVSNQNRNQIMRIEVKINDKIENTTKLSVVHFVEMSASN